jgi:hypothetical protein
MIENFEATKILQKFSAAEKEWNSKQKQMVDSHLELLKHS